jgi:hypothetical protein
MATTRAWHLAMLRYGRRPSWLVRSYAMVRPVYLQMNRHLIALDTQLRFFVGRIVTIIGEVSLVYDALVRWLLAAVVLFTSTRS